MPNAVSASQLSKGSWTAEFGVWIIWIRSVGSHWTARVASRLDGGSVLVGKSGVFMTAAEAVEWTCSVLRARGSHVLVDGQEQKLQDFLAFARAPEVCA